MHPRLEFGTRRLRMIFQSESSECGLACIAMIADYYGLQYDLSAIRSRFGISEKGMVMSQMIRHASTLGLGSRAVRLEPTELGKLPLPCILHWNLNHYVVLQKIGRNYIKVYDPATGVRKLTQSEFALSFTGVALEVFPEADFKPSDERKKLRLKELTGKISGLWRSLSIVLILAACLEFIALLSPLFNQWIIDDALSTLDLNLLNTLVIGFALLLIVQTAIGLARSWTMIYIGTSLSLQWSANIFSHLLDLPMAWYQRRGLGDIVSRFGAIGAIQSTLTGGVISSILDGVMAIATLIMMFKYSTGLGWIVICAVGSYAGLRVLAYAPLRQATNEVLILGAKEQSFFLESIRAVQAIKLFGNQNQRQSRWTNLRVDVINRSLQTQRFMMWFSLMNTAIFGAQNLLVFWYGAREIMASNGSFTIGMLMAFSSYASQFSGRLSACIDRVIDFTMLSLHGERLSDIVLTKREEKIDSPLNSIFLPDHSVEFIAVGIRYSSDDPWVIRNFNLKINSGEHVALAGPSGCGKSTLVKAILGLIPITEGEIRVGGVPLVNVPSHQLRGIIGAVMQDDQLLTGSVIENISFFDDTFDMGSIERASGMAQIDKEIQALPMRYNTQLGEMGGILSGGQKQRILLARALYRDPGILVLDEATSHLDSENEFRVNEAIRSLAITRISVAHRAETINAADRVIVICAGEILSEINNLEKRSILCN